MTNKQKIAELETKLRRYEKRAGDLLLRVLRTRGFCLTIFPARRNWLVAAILKLLVDIIQLFNIAVEIAERLMQRAIKAVHLARGVMSVNDGVQLVEKRNTIRFVGWQAVKSTVLSDKLYKFIPKYRCLVEILCCTPDEVKVWLVPELLHGVGRFVRSDHAAFFFGNGFLHIDFAAAGKRRGFAIPLAVRNDTRFNPTLRESPGFLFRDASARGGNAVIYSVSSSKMTSFSSALSKRTR